MVIHHKFVTLNGHASLYLMQCLNENLNAKKRVDDLKVSFNHTFSNPCLSSGTTVFCCSHVYFLISFLFCQKWQYSIFSCQKKILLQFYPSLLRSSFTIILLGSRNLIDFQYPSSHKMYHLVLVECL